jgi:DNA repair protein RadC
MIQLSTVNILATLTTVSIAQVLISRYGTLTEMAKAQVEELQTIPGIGPRKAQQIQSAFELAQLLSREVALEQPVMDTPERVAALFREEAKSANNEALYSDSQKKFPK